MKTDTFSDKDKQLISQIVDKLEEVENAPDARMAIISFGDLKSYLTNEEVKVLDTYLQIDPRNFGFKGEFFGLQKTPEDLVEIRDQMYLKRGIETNIPVQFLPQAVYASYIKLKEGIEHDLQKTLLIETGYRSNAFQAYLGLYLLRMYEYDLEKTLKRVALPGFSEHGCVSRQAVDFLTEEGSPSEDNPLDFAKTAEYQWLVHNAAKYGFEMSYPESNSLGVMFEPWHWRFVGI